MVAPSDLSCALLMLGALYHTEALGSFLTALMGFGPAQEGLIRYTLECSGFTSTKHLSMCLILSTAIVLPMENADKMSSSHPAE